MAATAVRGVVELFRKGKVLVVNVEFIFNDIKDLQVLDGRSHNDVKTRCLLLCGRLQLAGSHAVCKVLHFEFI